METRDTIALLALIVSLVSFWLSYRANTLSKTVAAAEKRTEICMAIIAMLRESEKVSSAIQDALKGNEDMYDRFPEIRQLGADIDGTISALTKRLEILSKGEIIDLVKLEQYKVHVHDARSHIDRISEILKNEMPPHWTSSLRNAAIADDSR